MHMKKPGSALLGWQIVANGQSFGSFGSQSW
jgi:hypothetical protein